MARIFEVLRVLSEISAEAYAEVEFHHELEGEPDEPREWHHAFVDAFVQAEDLDDRRLVRAYRSALIVAGWYRPMTADDLRHITVTSGRKWEFKMKGIPYRPHDGGLRVWLAAEPAP